MNRRYELIAPCHFGMEAVLKREIIDIGYEISKVSDGKVTFIGDDEAIARANICLATTERILLKVGEFTATTYEELFEMTKSLSWEEYIPRDGKFWITKATSIKSKLFSPSDIQSIMKKAIVDRLSKVYGISWFEESGAAYPIRVSLYGDIMTVCLDTTGESLHKRGYRTMVSKAPISECLAAAMIDITPWRSDRILVDPFCGSGTFCIEAAMKAAHISPGMNRDFTAMNWTNLIDTDIWQDARCEAREEVDMDIQTDIQGYDIDSKVIEAARANAIRAGVDKLIHFQKRDIADLSHHGKYGFIITNPPYGERIGASKEIAGLYKTLGQRYKMLDTWSMYMITSYPDAERCMGRKADKNRKIYNGMIKTYIYEYLGPKPPKRQREI